jgi:formylglycine-generating enzyme required for sulfatase activity
MWIRGSSGSFPNKLAADSKEHSRDPRRILHMLSILNAMLTWKDPKTGLEWQLQSPGKMNWHEAQAYARTLDLDGKNDWRVPTAAELESLLDRKTLYDRIRPTMREEVPFRDNLSYWSSTTFAPNTVSAWIVMFDGAYILSYYKSNPYHVRCVRCPR